MECLGSPAWQAGCKWLRPTFWTLRASREQRKSSCACIYFGSTVAESSLTVQVAEEKTIINWAYIGEEREQAVAFWCMPGVARVADKMPLHAWAMVICHVLLLGSNSSHHALLLVVTISFGFLVIRHFKLICNIHVLLQRIHKWRHCSWCMITFQSMKSRWPCTLSYCTAPVCMQAHLVLPDLISRRLSVEFLKH